MKIKVCTSGSDSEVVETLPITRERGKEKRVAMRLDSKGQADRSLPPLERGDRLDVTVEVELTTDAQEAHPRNNRVGNPYTYEPNLRASLLLAADGHETDVDGGRAKRLAADKHIVCNHPEHHRVVVFNYAGIRIPRDAPNWMLDSPSINLILSADHPRACPGDVLIVGEHNPGAHEDDPATVGGDKGRINAIRTRGTGAYAGRTITEKEESARSLPVDETKKQVLYSVALDNLRKGEQLSVDAAVVATAAALNHPARLSLRVFLAGDPADEEPKGRAKELASFSGEISENNGHNCVPKAGHQLSRKFGVTRLVKEPGDRVFVNLVAVSGNPIGDPKPGERLRILNTGYLSVTRHPPAED